MIEIIKKRIEKSLQSFIEKTKKDYKLHLVNPILYESIREFSLRKGKRIRPLLLVLSYKGYCPSHKRISPSLYTASTCIELLHNFMLIHDDIIDRSNLRRGKPTLHKILGKIMRTKENEKLGYDLGIIAGDIVYALAIDAFLSIHEAAQRKEKALKYFIQTAAFTAMGEFIDTIHGAENIPKVKEKDVFLNYTLKTARYTFDCPLVVGAILANASPKDIKKLSILGILTGQAFQIQDDIIGIFDSEKNIGKSILSDIAESKKTLLVCHAYDHLQGKERKELLYIFNKPLKTYKDLLRIRKIFIKTRSLDYSLAQIQDRLLKTLKILRGLRMNALHKKYIAEVILSLFNPSNRIAQEFGLTIQIKSPP